MLVQQAPASCPNSPDQPKLLISTFCATQARLGKGASRGTWYLTGADQPVDPPKSVNLGFPRQGARPGRCDLPAGPRRSHQHPAKPVSPAPRRLTHKEDKRPLLPNARILGCFMNTRIKTSTGFKDSLKENSADPPAGRDLWRLQERLGSGMLATQPASAARYSLREGDRDITRPE